MFEQVPHLILPSTPQNYTESRCGPGQLKHCSLPSIQELGPIPKQADKEGYQNDIVLRAVF